MSLVIPPPTSYTSENEAKQGPVVQGMPGVSLVWDWYSSERKEGRNVLFKTTHNTFNLWFYNIGHMVSEPQRYEK